MTPERDLLDAFEGMIDRQERQHRASTPADALMIYGIDPDEFADLLVQISEGMEKNCEAAGINVVDLPLGEHHVLFALMGLLTGMELQWRRAEKGDA